MKVATGTYIGDGVDDRQITGLGFTPSVVITRNLIANGATVWKNDAMTGTVAVIWDQVSGDFEVNDGIKSFDSDGFTLGTGIYANNNGDTYHWMAFEADADALGELTYTGDGTDDRDFFSVWSFTTAQFIFGGQASPNGVELGIRFSSKAGDNTHLMTQDDTAIPDHFQQANPGGVEIGTRINVSGETGYVMAIGNKDGNIRQFSYTGDGLDDRDIVSPDPFTPRIVFIRKDTASPSGARLVYRQDTLTGDETFKMAVGGTQANKIQKFNDDGFQVGSDAEVNQSGQTYHVLMIGFIPGEFLNPIELENVLIGRQETLCKGF